MINKLFISPTIQESADRKLYTNPARTKDNILTPTNFSEIGSSINLLVGTAAPNSDCAGADGKMLAADNLDAPVYTNYFITQLQVSRLASAGDIDDVILQLTYDEL